MYKVNQIFVDYICGEKSGINATELTAKVINEYGMTVYIKLNKEIPAIGRLNTTSQFGICKEDFNKYFIKM